MLKSAGETSTTSVKTFNENVDRCLGGPGLPSGCVTEVFGSAGQGKSQLCMHLSICAQMPKCLGGLEAAGVIYLDTEGSFSTARMTQITECVKSDVRQTVNGLFKDDLEKAERAMEAFNDPLSNVLCRKVETVDDLSETVERLPAMMRANPGVRLVIVDSLAFPFRYLSDEERQNLEKRSSQLAKITQKLQKLAFEFDAAVLITNHMTTKFGNREQGVEAPALGHTFGFLATQRFQVRGHPTREGVKVITRVKSPLAEVGFQALFCITQSGLRDVQ